MMREGSLISHRKAPRMPLPVDIVKREKRSRTRFRIGTRIRAPRMPLPMDRVKDKGQVSG